MNYVFHFSPDILNVKKAGGPQRKAHIIVEAQNIHKAKEKLSKYIAIGRELGYYTK